MKVIYEVEGKQFSDKDEAKAYEKKVEEEKAKEKKLAEEKEARHAEVQEAWKKYVELQKKYYEDYPSQELTKLYKWIW